MFFIRYDYKDGNIGRAESERKQRVKQERKLHQHCRPGCHIIIIITIIIALPEGFLHRQLQLIRLLSHLARDDLYLDIYFFIRLLTSLIECYEYFVLLVHFDRCTVDEDITSRMQRRERQRERETVRQQQVLLSVI